MSRPPRLPDSQIEALIEELRGRHAVLTGSLLRDELRRRFGTPCGVSRIYRLLRATTAPEPRSPPPSPSAATEQAPADVQAQLRQALERAELAEHREEAHQARWANEIHQLREQVQTLAQATSRLRVIESQLMDRSRELAAAYKRIADLEANLRLP